MNRGGFHICFIRGEQKFRVLNLVKNLSRIFRLERHKCMRYGTLITANVIETFRGNNT